MLLFRPFKSLQAVDENVGNVGSFSAYAVSLGIKKSSQRRILFVGRMMACRAG
jgi:hypothetical protein